MFQTTIIGLLALAAFAGLLMASVVQYACQPYTPQEECKLGRYEIRVHDITQRGAPTIGVAEGDCVYSVGSGKNKRYAMREATFTAANRTDYFERGVEIPAAQSTVCEVK